MNTIEQNNALIAEFMGFELINPSMRKNPDAWNHSYWENPKIKGGFKRVLCSEKGLIYDKNWSWIMPVVEKIESTYLKPHGYFGVYISSNSCTIQGTHLNTLKPELNVYFKEYHEDTKLKSTYEAVVNFIKWHQEQTK